MVTRKLVINLLLEFFSTFLLYIHQSFDFTPLNCISWIPLDRGTVLHSPAEALLSIHRLPGRCYLKIWPLLPLLDLAMKAA